MFEPLLAAHATAALGRMGSLLGLLFSLHERLPEACVGGTANSHGEAPRTDTAAARRNGGGAAQRSVPGSCRRKGRLGGTEQPSLLVTAPPARRFAYLPISDVAQFTANALKAVPLSSSAINGSGSSTTTGASAGAPMASSAVARPPPPILVSLRPLPGTKARAVGIPGSPGRATPANAAAATAAAAASNTVTAGFFSGVTGNFLSGLSAALASGVSGGAGGSSGAPHSASDASAVMFTSL